MEYKRYINKDNKKLKRVIIYMVFGLIVIGILFLIFYQKFYNNMETYTVMNGYVEKVVDTQSIILKDEKIMKVSNNSSIIPLVEQGKRVGKNDSIAVYKDNKYQDYTNQLSDIDKQIEVLIKDLPEVYSNDISYIENQIKVISNNARKATSYLKMQEYITQIKNYTNQKIKIVGDLSPSGSKVRELITKRESIEETYKKSSTNITSSISGCVTYKIDGLEDLIDVSKLSSYNSNDFENLFLKYKSNISNDFGIKIVNNFCAYLVIKVPNNEYVKEGNNYNIMLTDKSDIKENVSLLKTINCDDNNIYCIFKITNGIERLVDSRIENVEIIWNKKDGMVVPLDSITDLNENNNIGYVTLVKNGDYVNVPIKLELSNDNVSVVDNLTDDEKKNNNIECEQKLEIFDQVLMKQKK